MNVRFTLQIVLLTTIAALTATFVSAGAAGIRDGRSADTKDAARLAHQFAGSSTSKLAPDWFERYAAAHPYGQATPIAPDWFERYAAAHPYGRGTALGAVTVLDRRSPDTKDAAYNAQQHLLVPVDGRSPDTQDAAKNAQQHLLVPVDGRSPDTLDAAAVVTQPVQIVQPSGFDWTDAGIGAGGGFAIALIVGGAFLLTTRGSRGKLAV